MRIVNFYHARFWPPRARRVLPVLVVIIIVVLSGASFTGHGEAALIVVTMAALTVAVEELVRTALRYWGRIA